MYHIKKIDTIKKIVLAPKVFNGDTEIDSMSVGCMVLYNKIPGEYFTKTYECL